ncbi:MAG TPA: hypothetical protein VHU19_14390 [Pyrinomonadaceae bacterium]|jgi:hypothetical protein|nr:hypothetical protein [Pyrinomonadaceae bacterium]
MFRGEWAAAERRLVEMCVSAVDEYLDAHMPEPWVFEKAPGGFSVTQPSLLVTGARTATLAALVGTVRRAAEFAAPFVTHPNAPPDFVGGDDEN